MSAAQQQIDSGDDRLELAAERILTDQLPIPVRQRWQPLRAGLMNVFLFEDERFPFADGRLLLRGTNGTGKSRVLAMTLPLLLDGSFKATRIEPDRDPNRLVAWNLLMDDQPSRTGYAWLEFGRIDEDGEDLFLTIGCGMRAKRGQRIKPWFFISERRVDDALHLKSPDGVPLTQRKLDEALDGHGQVFETATEYRRAVDDRLFRLGERYDALIDLLLQLRQPKLAEKLDIVQLEEALRESLPPLPESLLDDAAEAFRDLDQYRHSLLSDRQMLNDISRFLKPYRDHVRRGVKRSLKELTSANSRFEHAQRELRSLTEKQANDEKRRVELEAQQQALRVEIGAGHTAINELMQSPEMRSAQRLDERKETARQLSEQLAACESESKKSETELAEAEKHAVAIESKVATQRESAMRESTKCREIAAPEALQNKHQEQLHRLFVGDDLLQFGELRKPLLRETKRFQKSADHLIGQNQQLDQLRRRLKSAREAVQRHDQERQESLDQLETARHTRSQTRTDLWDAILVWYEKAVPIKAHLPSIESWADRWHPWEADSHETDPSRSVVETAKSKSIAELIAKQARQRHESDALGVAATNLRDERARLEAGETIAPPPRAHRAERDAAKQTTSATHVDAGVPFWQLVEFHANVPESERGNWESALHDAGLLDAVLLPDGQLVAGVGEKDKSAVVQLAHAGMPALEEQRQLARVLRPAEESTFAAVRDALARVLCVIGVGHDAGTTWVASDGSWRNGPLRGRLTKLLPQYIGEDARDRWRKTRIDEIATQLRLLEEQLAAIAKIVDQLQEQRGEIENLAAAFPSSKPLLIATANALSAQKELDSRSQRLGRSQQQEAAEQRALDEATKRRDDDAADFGLSAWADRATELRARLLQYLTALDALAARIDTAQAVIDQAQQCRQAVAQALSRKQLVDTRRNRLQVDVGKADETVRVLEESVGQGAADVMRRLDDARAQQKQRTTDADRLAEQLSDQKTTIAVTANKLEERQADSTMSDGLRREATAWFSSLHDHGFLTFVAGDVAVPDVPWSMTAAIKLARQLDTVLSDVPSDDESWLTSQSRLHRAQTELQQTVLAQDGMAVEVQPLRDGLQDVTLAIQNERFAPPSAVTRLESEIATRARILDEKEQDTLEKYLLGEVAEGLRRGMHMASELVGMMTAEVCKRPMKTGMQMRFKWRRDEDGPPGLAEACEVLATDAATWSPGEREQIKQFLQRAIRQQRETEQTGSWHEHMRAALDYRRWHRIVIERRSGPEANWLKLTRRTYAGGSGGEKAIALTLPPLAAAAAYYQSADDLAPRFILLDEAFAGISSDMRESCMELIAAFGLDVVMTSEIEWGMYAGVKQLAICQLDRFSDINAVVNRVFVWNGSTKQQMVSRDEADETQRQPLFAEE